MTKQSGNSVKAKCLGCGIEFEQEYYWCKHCKGCYAVIKSEKQEKEWNAPPRLEFLKPELTQPEIAKLKTCIKNSNRLIPKLICTEPQIIEFCEWLNKSTFAELINEAYGGATAFAQKAIDENIVYKNQYEIRKIDSFSRIKAVIFEYFFRNYHRPVSYSFRIKE